MDVGSWPTATIAGQGAGPGQLSKPDVEAVRTELDAVAELAARLIDSGAMTSGVPNVDRRHRLFCSADVLNALSGLSAPRRRTVPLMLLHAWGTAAADRHFPRCYSEATAATNGRAGPTQPVTSPREPVCATEIYVENSIPVPSMHTKNLRKRIAKSSAKTSSANLSCPCCHLTQDPASHGTTKNGQGTK